MFPASGQTWGTNTGHWRLLEVREDQDNMDAVIVLPRCLKTEVRLAGETKVMICNM